ncbi:unnamed protein product [Orchesella dallaii]|uniref:Uncharacterized protein n=1 Tax=Orchesella dallaii TaxID=48710 RepID=A0ABP1Q032_9HEXA
MSPNYLMAVLCLVTNYPITSKASSIGKALYAHPRIPLSSYFKEKQRYPPIFQRQQSDENQFSVTSYDNDLVLQNGTSALVQNTGSVSNYEQVGLGNSEGSAYYPATSPNNYGAVAPENSVYYPATASNTNSNNFETGSPSESVYYPATSATPSDYNQQPTPSYMVPYESPNPSYGSELFDSTASNNPYSTVPYDSSNNVYSTVPYDSETPAYLNGGYSSQSNEILPQIDTTLYDTTPSAYYTNPYYESSNDQLIHQMPDPYQELVYATPQVTEEELLEGSSDPEPVVIYSPPGSGNGGFQQNGRPPSVSNGVYGVPPGVGMDETMGFDGGSDDMMMGGDEEGADDSDGGDEDMVMEHKPVDPTADDNNPLNFLNMMGTDFQPGRLVNIFFGLFIMLFMIIFHGYALWILGIAFLPGTRSLNEWEVDYDKVESACKLVLDAIEYWEKRVD